MGQASFIHFQYQKFLVQFAEQGGILDQCRGNAGQHIGTLCVGCHRLTRRTEGMGQHIGGGGLTVGSGNKVHLIIVNTLKMGHKIRHQLHSDFAGIVGSPLFVDDIHHKRHKLGDPQG